MEGYFFLPSFPPPPVSSPSPSSFFLEGVCWGLQLDGKNRTIHEDGTAPDCLTGQGPRQVLVGPAQCGSYCSILYPSWESLLRPKPAMPATSLPSPVHLPNTPPFPKYTRWLYVTWPSPLMPPPPVVFSLSHVWMLLLFPDAVTVAYWGPKTVLLKVWSLIDTSLQIVTGPQGDKYKVSNLK